MNIIEFIKKWFKKPKDESATEFDIQTFDVSESNISALVRSESSEPEITLDIVPIENSHYPMFFTNSNAKTIPPEETERSDKKGLLEDFFFDFLLEIKDYKFRNDMKIKVNERFLIPDFCLPAANLVIEIDEPYTFSNGQLKPIHYLDCDDDRNNLFVENGWQIIRFAEEQIIKYPKECCDFIVSVLSKQPIDIEKIVRWTYMDAEDMIKNNFRDTYLPIELKGVNGISKYSYRSLSIESIIKKFNKKGEMCIVIFVKTDESIKECWIAKKDFIKIFIETDFLKKSGLASERLLGKKIILNNILDTLKNEEDFLSGMRLVGKGVIEEKYLNLEPNSDFILDIPKDNTLRWVKHWNKERQKR